MTKIWVSPTGKVSTGHVLDVAVQPLERVLKDYDSQLYVKWNPRKLKGWGCWEVRRRPNLKTISDVVEHQGMSFVRIDYVENNLENHVLDVAYLNYEVLTKIKSMDQWNTNRRYFVDQLESREKSHQEQARAKTRSEMLYHAKQNRKAFQELKEAMRSGFNPHQIADYWK